MDCGEVKGGRKNIINTIDEANTLLQKILTDSLFSHLIDTDFKIPEVYEGKGKIQLIILGQDPTVKNYSSRAKIKTVLNLDRRSLLRDYLIEICNGLGLSLEKNIYATNLFKNFFVKPPTQIKEVNVFEEFPRWWLPFLRDELNSYPNIPVITLGEPLLSTLVDDGIKRRVRYYWGYTSRWKLGETATFKPINPTKNHLSRVLFPFPHQPSKNKEFYKDRIEDYCLHVKQYI